MVIAIRIILGVAIALAAVLAHGQTPAQTELIIHEAKKHNIDPDLALAIVEVESGFDSRAVGKLGERGLFQLRPEFHPGAVGSGDDTNIRLGIRYLALCRRLCGAALGDAFFTCFNYGPTRALKLEDPKGTEYYRRVTAIYHGRKSVN